MAKMKPCGGTPHSGKGTPVKGTNSHKTAPSPKGVKQPLPGQNKGTR